jgi:tetratricopeptide (TPR) repeat protein
MGETKMTTVLMWIATAGLVLASLGCAGSPKAGASPGAQSAGPVMTVTPPDGNDGERLLEAIELMDAGKLDASIGILETLRDRYPDNAIVLHELALAHRRAKRPGKAVELLSPHKQRLPPETLAALGSAFDEMGNKAEAEKVLREALEKFPDAGILYSELATTWANAGKLDEALRLYEHGAEVDPSFPANHLHLAKLLAHSRASGTALVEGEMFRLLEPVSPRSLEIGALLVDVCRKGVTIKKKTGAKFEATVSLAPNIAIDSPEQLAHLPLANMLELAFGPGLVRAHAEGFNLARLHQARVALLAVVNKPGSPYDWSSVPLFRWLRALDAAGHLEAYDYWLFGPGLVDEFGPWAEAHPGETRAMVAYMVTHPLFPPKNNSMFVRFPYLHDSPTGERDRRSALRGIAAAP